MEMEENLTVRVLLVYIPECHIHEAFIAGPRARRLDGDG
jgi:hypothetical protein